jgi:hypothetical protein
MKLNENGTHDVHMNYNTEEEYTTNSTEEEVLKKRNKIVGKDNDGKKRKWGKRCTK